MSQAERSKSHLSYFTRKKPRPTSNLHPNNKVTSSPHGHWSEPTTPTFGNQDNWCSPKKSVLIKVKEKAKKLRQILAKKRHPREGNNPITPEEATLHKERDEEIILRHSTPRSVVATDARNSSASEMKSTLQLPVDTCATASVSNPSNKEPVVEKSNNKMLHQPLLDNAGVEHITIPETIVMPTRLNNPAFTEKSVGDIPVRKDSTSSNSSMGKGSSEVLLQLASDNAAVEYINIPETAAIPTCLNNPAINEKSSDEIPVRKDSSISSMEKGNSEVLQQLALDNAAVEDITIPETTRLKDPTINEKSSNEIPVSKCSRSTCMEKGNNEVLQQQTDEHTTIPDTALVPTSLNNPCINEKSKDEIPVSKDRSSTEKANNEVLQQPTLDNTAVTPTNLNNPAINERSKDEIPVSKDISRMDKENKEMLQQLTLDNAAVEHLTIPDTAVIPTSLNNPAMNEKSSNEIPDSKDSRSVENGESGVLQQPTMDNPAFNYATIPETALKSTSLNNPAINEKSSNEVPVIKERSSGSGMEEGNNAMFQQLALDNDTVEYTTAPETAIIPTSLNNKKSKDERSVSTNRSSMEKGNNKVLQQLALDNAAVGYVNITESAMKPTSLNPSTNEKSSDEMPVSKDSNNSSMDKGNSKVLQQLVLDNAVVDSITITETVPVPTSHNPAINKKFLDEIQVIKARSSCSNNNNKNNNNSNNDNNRYNRSNSCKTLSKTVTDMLSPAYFIVSGATQAITSKIQKSSGPDSNRYNRSNSCKTLSKTVTDMLSPAYTVVSGATQAIASKIQGSSGPVYEIAAKQVWDKSTSVKDYLMHKLEPGEEDKALCNVITAAVSPKCVSPANEEVATMSKEVSW